MHIGIIPDGNRRWASEHGLSFHQAYANGFRVGIDLTLRLVDLGFRHITFYGLTNGNYVKRPQDQVESILSQIIGSMVAETPRLLSKRVRTNFYGQIEQFRADHQENLAKIQQSTISLEHPAANLNVLVNYSPEWDFSAEPGSLATHKIPACDLVFRSGDVKRLSGFLPLQSANAELYFSSKLWPDVQASDVERAVGRFNKVKRNFGA